MRPLKFNDVEPGQIIVERGEDMFYYYIIVDLITGWYGFNVTMKFLYGESRIADELGYRPAWDEPPECQSLSMNYICGNQDWFVL